MSSWNYPSDHFYEENFLKSFANFVNDLKQKYGSDFRQGFISDSSFATIKRYMLKCSSLTRSQFGNLTVKLGLYNEAIISIEDSQKLWINQVYFKQEKMDISPIAVYIRNSTKSVIEFNYAGHADGSLVFYRNNIVDIMAEFDLSKEEAQEYLKIMSCPKIEEIIK